MRFPILAFLDSSLGVLGRLQAGLDQNRNHLLPPTQAESACVPQPALHIHLWCQPVHQNQGGSADGCTMDAAPVPYFSLFAKALIGATE